MNRQEFMEKLEYLLRGIPENERADALAYYNDYFDEAGVENEYQVIQELGSPEQVAQTILEDVQREASQSVRQDYSSPEAECNEGHKEEKKNYEQQHTNTYTSQTTTTEKQGMPTSTKVLLIIVLILTFPLWIGIVAGLFGGLVGCIGALFGIIVGLIGAAIGLVVGGIACVIGGIACLMVSPVDGLVSIGVGAILAAIGILLALPCIWGVGIWIPKAIKALVAWIKGLFHRNEGGNEI
ncbi:MAG: hypothetical protein IJE49_06215 [Agathobacter sp.]|nr:hypothetical protein [Agathobacter sp.]